MKTSGITTTNISLAYKKELKKMATACGKTQMGFLQDCIYYFKVTGMNPAMVEPFSPKEAIDKLSKRVDTAISFFQKHEKEKLQPLLDKLIIVSAKLSKNIESTIVKSDLQELQQTIHTLQREQAKLLEMIKSSSEVEKRLYDNIKNGLNEAHSRYMQHQNKTQKMIEILFQAVSTRGLSGVKQEFIDEFDKIVKTK